MPLMLLCYILQVNVGVFVRRRAGEALVQPLDENCSSQHCVLLQITAAELLTSSRWLAAPLSTSWEKPVSMVTSCYYYLCIAE